jgi:mannose-6-phosphate isomerase-like protein (cupin superfamily)
MERPSKKSGSKKKGTGKEASKQVPPPPPPPQASKKCYIASLPKDIILRMILNSDFSIRDTIHWCSTDVEMRRICQEEYVWKKLYFLKVVQDQQLMEMEDRKDDLPIIRNYIENTLMKTPAGIQWEAQKVFAESPLILLVAFVFRAELRGTKMKNYEMFFTSTDTRFQSFRLHRSRALHDYNVYATLDYDSTKINILEEWNIPHVDSSSHTYTIDPDYVIYFMCMALKHFNLERRTHTFTFTESSIVCANCTSPEIKLQCSACRRIAYCSEKCGKEYFQKVHYIECMYHMKDNWSIIQTNEEPKKLLFDTGDMSGYAIAIKPEGNLKREVHPDATQFFLVIQGEGTCIIEDKNDQISMHSMFYVPRGKVHSIQAGSKGLKLLTLYAPATHHTE